MVDMTDGDSSSKSSEKQPLVPELKQDVIYLRDEDNVGSGRQPMCRRWMKCGGWVCKLPKDLLQSLRYVILGTKLNVLLLCVPLAMLGVQLNFGHVISFPIPLHLITNANSFFVPSFTGNIMRSVVSCDFIQDFTADVAESVPQFSMDNAAQ
jgi:hypothetical protein